MGASFTSPYLRPPLSYTGGGINRALLPAAATHTIAVDLRAGTRIVETKRETPPQLAPCPATVDRPAVIRRFKPNAICPVCRVEFPQPTNSGPRTYCSTNCAAIGRSILKRNSGIPTPYKPIDIKAEAHAAVTAVCAVFKVGRDAILTPNRGNKFATVPRLMAYALVRDLRPDASTNDIGRAFERDHSSILSGFNAHKERMQRESYAMKWREALALCQPQQEAA